MCSSTTINLLSQFKTNNNTNLRQIVYKSYRIWPFCHRFCQKYFLDGQSNNHLIRHSLCENVNLSQSLNKLILDCIICIIMTCHWPIRIHRRPPGARAFSRLPNDKKGKALGTRLDEGLWPNPYQTGIWLATTKVIVLIPDIFYYHVFMVSGYGFGQSPSSRRA